MGLGVTTNILHLTLIGSQSQLKMIDINRYYGGPLINPNDIDKLTFKGPRYQALLYGAMS